MDNNTYNRLKGISVPHPDYTKNIIPAYQEEKDDECCESVVIDHQEDLDISIRSEEKGVYPMNTIKTERAFYTIYELKRKYGKSPAQIILDSDFQRNSVWKLQQKRELIESVLMGLPLPIFYFNQDRKGSLIVIDGRQRLTAFFEFLDEKKGFSLDGLSILSDLNKKKFRDLPIDLQTKIEDYQIIAHVIPPSTPDRIKFDIFDRVNRSGTKLNKQEIRNALYQGNATRLLLNLSKEPAFAEATENVFKRETRMKDRYILLRFLSFYLLYNGYLTTSKKTDAYRYSGDIDELLGVAMDYLNQCSEQELAQFTNVTLTALDMVNKYLGINAFRLTDVQEDGSLKRFPININIFETIMLAMTMLSDDALLSKNIIVSTVEELKNSEAFRDSLINHRDSGLKTRARYEMTKKIVKEIQDKSERQQR